MILIANGMTSSCASSLSLLLPESWCSQSLSELLIYKAPSLVSGQLTLAAIVFSATLRQVMVNAFNL